MGRKRKEYGECLEYCMMLLEFGIPYWAVGRVYRIDDRLLMLTLCRRGRELVRGIGHCEGCGVVGVKLNFHHTDYIANTGKALCDSCHAKFHGTSGDSVFGRTLLGTPELCDVIDAIRLECGVSVIGSEYE